MIKQALAIACTAAAVAIPGAANAELIQGTLAGYPASAIDNGSLDALQINGPRGIISVAVNCYNGDFSWIGRHGDKWIVDVAVNEWCF